jgi:hypothetical protein
MAPSAPAGFLKVQGTEIVDSNGQRVILKGVGLQRLRIRQYSSSP